MASNPTPDDSDVLLALAEDIADGCHDHEVAIGIKQNTEAALRAAITALNTQQLTLANLKNATETKSGLLQAADAAGKEVIGNSRRRLSKLHGERYNSGWEAAGFPDESTAVPKTPDKRFTLLGKLAAYYTATPAAESADMDATAAICTTAHGAVSDARQALHTAEMNQSNGIKTRDAALRTLRLKVRGLITELEGLVADDDERWTAFGLNVPAHPVAPEAIDSLTLEALGDGKVHAVWTYSRRMNNTRLMVRRVGVDDDFVSVGIVDGLEKTLSGHTAGLTLEVKAIATNDGGDAPPSPTQSVVVT